MIKRTDTRPVMVRDLQIGGQNKIVIQSMCNSKTSDIESTVLQILSLEKRGCELVRLAILDKDDAMAISKIKKLTHIPLVADIHYDYKLALLVIENGIDKIRINPGNIGKKEYVELVVNACKEKHIPIRIGVNAGSLEKDLEDQYGYNSPIAMVESAKRHVKILEDLDFHDIVISLKSSDVMTSIKAYELASQTFPYPLHLGVSEAGPFNVSAIKSAAGLGILINEGIGDTIRISISDDPVVEIDACKELLACFNLYENKPNLISCPTCGRLQYNSLVVIKEIEDYLKTINKHVTVAIMGCPVNGISEAKNADIGIAGGKNEALLFKKGQIIRKISQEEIVEVLKKEIDEF
jgi:(E)-4-hydroxy-3-methylbut-2-enyl-diphosphate synthase